MTATRGEVVFDAIVQRRNTKPEKFSEKKVSPEVFEKVLESANWAPTHAYTEPWRYIIFMEAGLAALGRFEADWYKQNTPSHLFMERKFQKYLKRPDFSTYTLAIVWHRKTSGKTIPEIEEIASVACSVQNMFITATALGCAAYWGSGGATYSEEMRLFLDLQENEKCMGFFYLGHPSETPPQGHRLTEINEKVRFRKS